MTTAGSTDQSYLPSGMPGPAAQGDGLDAPYWEGAREGILRIQQCDGCGQHLWGPEWICHACHSFDLNWIDVEPRGTVYSWERVWHPVHPALADACPYMVVLVELPQAGNVRMVGNLLGEPRDSIGIGDEVEAVFEHHNDEDPPYTLVQWQRVED